LKSATIEAFSAGIVAHGQNPNAIRVMAEDGVDITGQQSKTLQSLLDAGVTFDIVYTVCGHADGNCPLFPGGTKVVHHGFDDPPKLAKGAATEEEALGHYRRVRDEIRAWIETL
jgi:arsenate reductase (thioredoxin)